MRIVTTREALSPTPIMSLSARHAALILLVPFASLLAQTGTLPPALASLRARADAGERADLIAYLKQAAHSPACQR